MRGVDQQNINTGGNQRINTLFITCACTNRSTHAQTTMLIFTGVRFTFCFLEIFYGDHAEKMEAVINNQRFLNTFFVHFCKHNITRFTFAYGYQTLFRRHVNANRLAEVGNKAYVTASDDTDQFVVFRYNRVACKAITLGQFFHFTQRGGWQYGLWIGHHARFVFFHTFNFFSLALDGHVFVDKTDAAFLSQGNCQACFRHGVHCRREHRNVQANGFRQLRAEVSCIRQNGRMSGNEEDVVKRQGFFSDT